MADTSGITTAVLAGSNSPDGQQDTDGDAARYAGPEGAVVGHYDNGSQQAVINANPVKTAGPQSKFTAARPGRGQRPGRSK
jgi:hypothetical protein